MSDWSDGIPPNPLRPFSPLPMYEEAASCVWTSILSEEQELFRRSVAEFVDKEVVPVSVQILILRASDGTFHVV